MKPSQVPVFILAGGLGTRLSEETHLRPKPMVEIGEYPILVHIMKWYYSFGFNDFVICAGYRSWDIKDYFLNYNFRLNNLEIDGRKKTAHPEVLGVNHRQEKWRVRVIDTGLETMTGGRIAKALDVISGSQSFETFAVTYGDGVSNVDLGQELDFHIRSQRIGTMLGVPPIARFGEVSVDATGVVQSFVEKPALKRGIINGGFFFFNREFGRYLSPQDNCILEKTPLEKLAEDRQLMVYEHSGFWQCMDTLRDKNHLQQMWDSGQAPWKVKEGNSLVLAG